MACSELLEPDMGSRRTDVFNPSWVKKPKIRFYSYFHTLWPNNCGVVFCEKIF